MFTTHSRPSPIIPQHRRQVTIRYTSTVDLSALKSFVEGTLGAEPPQGALQVLDLVLRNGVSSKWASSQSAGWCRPQGRP